MLSWNLAAAGRIQVPTDSSDDRRLPRVTGSEDIAREGPGEQRTG
jgi:hypothetical protein